MMNMFHMDEIGFPKRILDEWIRTTSKLDYYYDYSDVDEFPIDLLLAIQHHPKCMESFWQFWIYVSKQWWFQCYQAWRASIDKACNK